MKNLAKLFLVVATMLAGFACTTDATEDLGVQLGSTGQTVIDLSLEDSRTHISDKNGDEYPLYWSEGDKIAVNGIASEALTSAYHGQPNAQFTVNAVLEFPRDIVYPAPAEGVTASESKRAVTFQTIQEYTPGTFAEGATPLYAQVKADGYGATLKHLAGVLRIAPKGEGVTLVSMSVEAENGKLAGNFDIDCANGALTPQGDCTSNVTVSFGENGLTLGTEETPIYVAVPAGDYGTITVTLYTATDSMVVSFDTTGDKKIKAGIIREFTPFNYVANSTDTETFLIYNEASLRLFAERAANFAPYTKAKVTANIDMTGKAWSPVSGFNGEYEFDGGNNNIKGLSAPLFDTTATSIKNVRLVDIDMTVSGGDESALARCISSTTAVVENCYVSGKFTIDANSPAIVHGQSLHYASIVSYSYSTQNFSNLTADVEIVAKGNFGASQTRIAGILGNHYGKLSNATNLGSITFEGEINESPMLSGVAHCCNEGMENCTNKGNLTVNGKLSKNLMMSGVASYGQTTITNCNNYGDITMDTDLGEGELYLSGFLSRTHAKALTAKDCNNYGDIIIKGNAGHSRISGFIEEDWDKNMTITNCHNHGDVTLDSGAKISSSFVLGGLLGYRNDANSNVTLTNCSNNGALTIKSGATITGNLQFGGIIAYPVTNDANYKTTLTSCVNNGTLTVEKGANLSASYIGGIVGNKANKGKLYLDGCTNKGSVNYEGTGSGFLQVAGIVGTYAGTAATLVVKNTVTNEGTVNVGGSSKGNTRIGGIFGAFAQTWSSESAGGTIWNKGTINVSVVNNITPAATSTLIGGIAGAVGVPNEGGVTWYNEGDLNVTSSNVYVGGLIGKITTNKVVKSAYSFCNIKATNASGAGALIGGTRGYLLNTCGVGGTIQKAGMSEPVTLNIENFHSYVYNSAEERETIVTTDVIGYIGAIDDTPLFDLPTKINSVEELIAFAANPTTTNILLGADMDLTDVEWTSIENFSGTFDGDNHKIIGLKTPLFGSTTGAASLQNIHLTNVNIAQGDGDSYIGALVRHIDNSAAIIRNCSAEGTININVTNPGTSTHYVGGLVGRTTTTKKTSGLVSKINFTTDGNIFAIYLGGCVGSAPYSIVDNCQNYGTLTLNGMYGGSQLVGGVVATCAGVTNCTNGSEKVGEKQVLGKITYNGEHYGTATRYIDLAGVCAFTNATASVGSGCKNYGAIDAGGSVISGSNTMFRVGGVFVNAERISGGKVTNCENYGDITISHKNRGTKNAMISGVCTVIGVGLNLAELSNLHNYGNITVTKDASFNASVLFGGIMNVFDNPRTYKNLYNHGNLTIEDGVTIGNEVFFGGVTGRCKTDAAGSFEGTIGNEGKLTMGATVTSSACIGGVFGYYGAPNINTNVINTGDLSVTGTLNGVYYIGGVCGGALATGSITNAKCYCSIYPGVYLAGFIFGKERVDNTKAINCQIGGAMLTYDTEDESYHDKPLTADNFYNYIYCSGDTSDWAGTSNYDGCTFLSSKPSLQ